ncbi:NAD-dependent epimerase/dehydratase family protein [Psychromicrobium sp. YIM B11713]|uniref:NAD-dependent epimerase/dehydratase family protein n=1 Tax=Psychromicrobium sp. YIM B11713 TaxID=3145233 RepID=UPI00374FB7F6
MAQQFILGAGLIGAELARQLSAAGDQVLIGSRRGTPVAGATAVVVNGSDAHALTEAVRGSETLFICTNPPYHTWAEEWPPIGRAAIAAAKATGAKIVLMGNLYAYGVPDGAMTAQTPFNPHDSKGQIRAELWQSLLSAQEKGDIRAAEVRASDYFGPGSSVNAHLGDRFFGPLLEGKTTQVVGDPSLKHSWAYLPDIAETLIAVAREEDALSRAWVTPHSSHDSRLRIADQVAELSGVQGKVIGIPGWVLRGMGLFNPRMREVAASSYQFTHEFIADSTETEERFGLRATPFEQALHTTLDSIKAL